MNTDHNRSVNAGGSITGSIVQTGDLNQASSTFVQLPQPDAVDINAVIAALRTELLTLEAPDKSKIERALADAQEEAEKAEPDREELGGALHRALGYAQKASDFSEHATNIADLVTKVGGWLGTTSQFIGPLLAMVGLSAL
ncbi:MAG TPA: hypothetical protein VFP12_11500 [Allosphingosinicella sp.]|nr:hypothetical protein [Allosphingosinicella sp.]